MGAGGRVLEPRRLGLDGLGLHANAVQLLGALGQLRVELPACGERAPGLLLRLLEDAALLRQLESRPFDLGTNLLEPGTRTVALGDELDAALLAARTAADDVPPHDGCRSA